MKFLCFFSFITQQERETSMAESGDVCPSGKYDVEEHQYWCEYANELNREGVYFDSLPWWVITYWTVKERETVYPPRLWSTVVAEGWTPYNCG